jgi:hypothetical protein
MSPSSDEMPLPLKLRDHLRELLQKVLARNVRTQPNTSEDTLQPMVSPGQTRDRQDGDDPT